VRLTEFTHPTRRANEAIRLMRALWSGEFREGTFEPRPATQPEIWVGGSSEPAIRRALELGDVWHPSRGSDADHVRRVNEQHPTCG
jgi:alkanesulfonate monooxygenase SsuD/methylene tetrahydromethanopterin reductase-like flavin-dependent oxidoreductase (luciferase family)